MEPYLYHGIKWYDFDRLIKILKTGYILPRSMIVENFDNNFNLFNGTEYISLVQKTLASYDRDIYRIAYDEFIYNKVMLVLDNKNIKIIYPNTITIFDKDMMPPNEWHKLLYNNSKERYSDYCDEVQTNEKVDLKQNLLAVGIPMIFLENNYSNEDIKSLLNRIKKELLDKEINVPIINSSIYECAENEENIKKYTI